MEIFFSAGDTADIGKRDPVAYPLDNEMAGYARAMKSIGLIISVALATV